MSDYTDVDRSDDVSFDAAIRSTHLSCFLNGWMYRCWFFKLMLMFSFQSPDLKVTIPSCVIIYTLKCGPFICSHFRSLNNFHLVPICCAVACTARFLHQTINQEEQTTIKPNKYNILLALCTFLFIANCSLLFRFRRGPIFHLCILAWLLLICSFFPPKTTLNS